MANQVNLKLSDNLYSSAEAFVERYGYRNLQELIYDAVREKIFEKSGFDESVSPAEVDAVERLLAHSISENKLVGEQEARAFLKK